MMPASNSQVSLGELARLAFPRGTPVPAAVREREARWVVVAGSGVVPQAGDVVLCASWPARKELAAWAERGVAAVFGLGGEAPPKVDLPVLSLPADASIRDLQQAALELIVNRQAYLVTRGGQIYQTLARLSVEGVGLPGLAQAMSEQTGKAVLVQDKRLQPLAEAVPAGLIAEWPAALETLQAWSQLPDTLRDRRQATVGGWRDQPLANGLIRLVCPIVAKGMARGFLSIIGRAGELDALDQLMVEHGAAACALEMAKAKAVSEAEKRAHGDFVDAVLTGSVSLDELGRWAQRIGYDVEPPHAALIWRWASRAETPSLRRLETLVNQSAAKLGANAMIRPRNNEVVVFCAVAEVGRPDPALKLAAAIHRAAAEEYPQQPTYSGLGRPAGELADWKDSYREAVQALSMAARLHESAPLFFGDLSVYRLLFQLEGSPELESFCREVLGPLMDYEGSGDLLETLEAFCDRLGNLSQTAEKLFIHRNSLLYRMERIGQLAGIDMNNPDTRLAVHLALKIRRMLRPAPTRKER